MVLDPRKVVGGQVMAKAMHATAMLECTMRYGVNKKEKVLIDVVDGVVYGTDNDRTK